MEIIKDKRILIVITIIIIIFSMCSLITIPTYNNIDRDSGVFLYGGQQILNGEIIYKDFWLNNTPMIFLINAFGLSFGLGVLGVWLIEFILLGFVLVYFTLSIIKHFGFWEGSISGIILSILSRSPDMLEGGNLSEIYAVGFIFILITYVLNNKDKTVKWIFPGFLSVLIFLTKPSLIAVPISIIIWLIYNLIKKKEKKYFLNTTYFILGSIITILITIIILGIFGILRDFWDAVFVYTSYFLKTGSFSNLELTKNLLYGLFDHHLENIIMFSLFSTVIIFSFKQFDDDNLRLFSFIASVGLFLNLIFIMLPGNFFGHYYYSLIPIIVIGMLLFLVILFSKIFTSVNKNHIKVITIIFILFLIVLYYPVYQIGQGYVNLISLTPGHFLQAKNKNKTETIVADYIKSLPVEYDILLWGEEPKYYFLTGKKCSIKYMFVSPMLTEGYFTQEKFNEVFYKLENSPPEIIMDVSFNSPKVPPINKIDREIFHYMDGYNWKGIAEFYKFVEENYSLTDIEVPGENLWKLYILKNYEIN